VKDLYGMATRCPSFAAEIARAREAREEAEISFVASDALSKLRRGNRARAHGHLPCADGSRWGPSCAWGCVGRLFTQPDAALLRIQPDAARRCFTSYPASPRILSCSAASDGSISTCMMAVSDLGWFPGLFWRARDAGLGSPAAQRCLLYDASDTEFDGRHNVCSIESANVSSWWA
jgi:hypothetical protein